MENISYKIIDVVILVLIRLQPLSIRITNCYLIDKLFQVNGVTETWSSIDKLIKLQIINI